MSWREFLFFSIALGLSLTLLYYRLCDKIKESRACPTCDCACVAVERANFEGKYDELHSRYVIFGNEGKEER